MFLFLLALYFFRRAEERAFYEHTQFMKKYLSENSCLTVKKNKRRWNLQKKGLFSRVLFFFYKSSRRVKNTLFCQNQRRKLFLNLLHRCEERKKNELFVLFNQRTGSIFRKHAWRSENGLTFCKRLSKRVLSHRWSDTLWCNAKYFW